MFPITAFALKVTGTDNIRSARPALAALFAKKHRSVKAHRIADALLEDGIINRAFESELASLFEVPQETIADVLRANRIAHQLAEDTAYFAEHGPHVHAELGRPKGSICIAAVTLGNKNIASLPCDIRALPEDEQYALVRQAIGRMMQEHGEYIRGMFTEVHQFTYWRTLDERIGFDIKGNVLPAGRQPGIRTELWAELV